MKLFFLTLTLFATLPLFAQAQVEESIRGFIPRPEAVYVSVYSGGCTSKSDFRIQTTEGNSRRLIRLYRTRKDECLAFLPMGKTIAFSYHELGLKSGDHFKITNPISDSVVW